MLKLRPAVPGIHCFQVSDVHSWKPRQHPAFSQETAIPQPFHMTLQATGHALQVWSLLFWFLGEVEIVHVIQGLIT